MKKLSKILVVVLAISFCLSLFSFSVSAESTVETLSEYYEGEYDSGVHQGYAFIFFGQVSDLSSEYGIILTLEGGASYLYEGKVIGEEGKFAIGIYNLPDGIYSVKAYSGEEGSRIYGESIEVIKGELYTREGNTIYFGSYPQSEVSDIALVSNLNSLAGILPTSENSQNWTSYEYYINELKSDFMWYIDIMFEGEKYRGVYFNQYRPYFTSGSSNTGNSYVDDNGYTKEIAYWFKYEPISWTILDESKGLILCDMIIDSQQYDTSSNNYANSDIRAWLNDTFYNIAFTTLQKSVIKTTTVDNSARSTNPNNNATYWNNGVNNYACSDTQDKIFLLSMKEVTNTSYGYNKNPMANDTARSKEPTDYTKSQGCYIYSGASYDGNGIWWLRSPYYNDSTYSLLIYNDGYAYNTFRVYINDVGIVPALQIQL